MREYAGPSLKSRTTLRLGGNALAELELEREEDIALLPQKLRELGGQPFCMGRGSNILAREGELPIVLIRPSFARDIAIVGEDGDKVLVKCGAAVPMPGLLRFCLVNGLSGLEGLTGIPGSVGGAVMMNAGSFGRETMDMVESVGVAFEGEKKVFHSSDIEKKYRSIAFLNQSGAPVVLYAIFALTRSPKNVILGHMSLNFFEKKSRQPLEAWSAGCAFKNPSRGCSAGLLLEKAGFRGKKKGGMAFSGKHANFLINEGHGSSGAAMDLLAEAVDAVLERFGIKLELEVRVIP